MTTCVVLLRGINVGGHNRVSMADLRRLLGNIGATDARTYLQSGNAVVQWEGTASTLEAAVREALRRELDLDLAVMVRTCAQLDKVITANPLPVSDPKMLHVGFTSAVPDSAVFAGLDHEALLPDRVAMGERALYLGYAEVSRNTPLARVKWGVDVTARNWRTVLALQELCVSRA